MGSPVRVHGVGRFILLQHNDRVKLLAAENGTVRLNGLFQPDISASGVDGGGILIELDLVDMEALVAEIDWENSTAGGDSGLTTLCLRLLRAVELHPASEKAWGRATIFEEPAVLLEFFGTVGPELLRSSDGESLSAQVRGIMAYCAEEICSRCPDLRSSAAPEEASE